MKQVDHLRWATLQRIADALGLPIEQFLVDRPSEGPTEAAEECMRLWSRIRTAEGRRKALESLRAIAEEEA